MFLMHEELLANWVHPDVRAWVIIRSTVYLWIMLVSASSKGGSLEGSKLVVVCYTSGGFSRWFQIASCAPRQVSHQWDILQNAFVPFARQHFGDNYRCQDDNATSHCAQVVCDFLQEGNVTNMEQPAKSLGCNPIEHIWDELSRVTTSMDNMPKNFGELCQALLNKWAENVVERPQNLVASMPRRLAAIID